jgi:hypothetical protein
MAGRSMRTVVPSPSSESIDTHPPQISTSHFTVERPTPCPSCAAFARNPGSKTRSSAEREIPRPQKQEPRQHAESAHPDVHQQNVALHPSDPGAAVADLGCVEPNHLLSGRVEASDRILDGEEG